MRIGPDLRISVAARGFVLLALGGPILWDRDVVSVLALAALAAEVVGRQITVVNNCAYTVWYVLVVVILSAR